jgi:hypothetical protein
MWSHSGVGLVMEVLFFPLGAGIEMGYLGKLGKELAF